MSLNDGIERKREILLWVRADEIGGARREQTMTELEVERERITRLEETLKLMEEQTNREIEAFHERGGRS